MTGQSLNLKKSEITEIRTVIDFEGGRNLRNFCPKMTTKTNQTNFQITEDENESLSCAVYVQI